MDRRALRTGGVWLAAMLLALTQPAAACHASRGYSAGALWTEAGPAPAQLWFEDEVTYPCEGDHAIRVVTAPAVGPGVDEVLPARFEVLASVPPGASCAWAGCAEVAALTFVRLTALEGPDALSLEGFGVYPTEYGKHLDLAGTYRGMRAAFVVAVP